MKYIIDIDALKECLDLIFKPYCINGKDCVYLDVVKEMIDRFPKDNADNNEAITNTRSVFEFCQDCGNYGWDMPQCRECNSENGYKNFIRKYNDNK